MDFDSIQIKLEPDFDIHDDGTQFWVFTLWTENQHKTIAQHTFDTNGEEEDEYYDKASDVQEPCGMPKSTAMAVAATSIFTEDNSKQQNEKWSRKVEMWEMFDLM